MDVFYILQLLRKKFLKNFQSSYKMLLSFFDEFLRQDKFVSWRLQILIHV